MTEFLEFKNPDELSAAVLISPKSVFFTQHCLEAQFVLYLRKLQ